jgi:hypothetical protein
MKEGDYYPPESHRYELPTQDFSRSKQEPISERMHVALSPTGLPLRTSRLTVFSGIRFRRCGEKILINTEGYLAGCPLRLEDL